MKLKLLLIGLLLALFATACAAQDATEAPGGSTAVATTSTENGTATEEPGEADTTSTPVVATDAPTQAAEETAAAPTTAAGEGTPGQEAAGTAGIPQTGDGDAGVPDDLDEMLRVLRTAGATVKLGDTVEQDFLSVPGQILTINGEEVQLFVYNSAEELETQASQLATNAGTEEEPHFYKLGNMLVRYVGREPDIRDLLEDVLGAQAVGQ